jgi:organic radical activating enzyme
MRISLSLVRTLAANLVRARIGRRRSVSPFAVAWHATNACNLRCSYCDDGRGRRYPDLGGRVMTTAEAKHALSLAREAVSVLYVTGGEPLLRNDLAEILGWAKRDARFDFVGLATNGTLLHRKESVLEHVDEIEISLDSLDHADYDSVLDAGTGTSRTIQDAVLRYHELAPERGYHLSVTCVAMPGRIRHARDVVGFCFERGIPCGVLPQSKGPYPEAGLRNDPDYVGFIDDVVAAKRQGAPAYGSYAYYSHIREFRAFRCYPTLVPRILPNGDLSYPCSPCGTVAGNLVGASSFRETLAEGRRRHGPVPSCDARCFASCYIETSNAINAPLAMLRERVQFARHNRPKHILPALSGSPLADLDA